MNFSTIKNSGVQGFTLIEILIALTIVSIALTAIAKSSMQNIKDTYYLQQKTLALWIGTEAMNAAKCGLVKPTFDVNEVQEEKQALNNRWLTKTFLSPSANPKIPKVHVQVYRVTDKAPLIELTSYLYAIQD